MRNEKGAVMKPGIWALILFLLLPGGAHAAKISIAVPTLSFDSLPMFLAQDGGFFAKHGVDADVIAMRGGGEAMKAFVAGDVAAVGVGFPEVALMRERGIDAVLLVAQTTRPAFSLIARKELGITSMAGLKGKNIGVSTPGSLTEYLVYYLAMKQGWDGKRDIGVIALGGGPELLGALVAKKVDAAMIMEPFRTIGLSNGTASEVADITEELDAFPTGPLVVKRSLLDQSPRLAQALHDAVADSLAFIHSDRAGTEAEAQKRFPAMKPALISVILERMDKVYSRDGNFSRANIELSQEICQRLGILKQIYPFEDIVAPVAR
jgi:NitT/TauT family transport system substrate-binding protein